MHRALRANGGRSGKRGAKGVSHARKSPRESRKQVHRGFTTKELDARGGIRTHELLRERILSPPVLARLAYPRFPKIVHMVFEEEMY